MLDPGMKGRPVKLSEQGEAIPEQATRGGKKEQKKKGCEGSDT